MIYKAPKSQKESGRIWTYAYGPPAHTTHSKHCTGRYQHTREDQVDQERTRKAQKLVKVENTFMKHHKTKNKQEAQLPLK